MFLSFIQICTTNKAKYQETLKPQNVIALSPPPLLLYTSILLHQRVIHFPIELFIQVEHVRRHVLNILRGSVGAVIKRFENEREDDSAIVFVSDRNPIKRLAVPEQQDLLRDLRVIPAPRAHKNVGAGDALGDALEERHAVGHDVLRLHQLQQILQLVEEPGLLRRVAVRPVLQQGLDDLALRRGGERYGLAERRVLRDVERHAVGELDGVVLVGLRLVQRDERALQGELVLRPNGHGEAVDDRGQDLQQLRDAVVRLLLVEELVEHVVDRFADRHAAVRQLAVDSVRDGFEELALALVQRVEQRDQMRQKLVVDESLPQVVVDLRRQHQADQQLVHQRQVRPLGVREHVVPVVVLRRRVDQLRATGPRTPTSEASGSARNRFWLIMLIVSWRHFGSLNSCLARQPTRQRPPQHLRRFGQLQQRVALQVARVLLAGAREIEANAADEELFPKQGAALWSQNLCE